ncbi:MAG TPA: sugar ABC transporter substrate-binding protein [Actinomycetota bacterium]|nr:sugar ABC transporter substrate-binding protein [Actinomycetota bacterium]
MGKTKMWAVAVALVLLAAACSSDGGGGQQSDGNGDGGGAVAQRDFRFVAVTHGQASDPFWSVAANGFDDAATDMGVEVEYRAPQTFDMVQMSELIDAAVASEPDGLIVSIPDADALRTSIESAVDAGIPVISMNSGSDDFADLGVLVHIGQTEFEAGLIAGQRFAEEGVQNAICVNQEVGNVALDLRCEGFFEGLGQQGEVVPVDLNNPQAATETVTGALQAGDIDGILTLGPSGADPTLMALQQAGSIGDITFATFDLSSSVLQAIEDGDMLFAIDQAQYLQGYLPVVFMTQYLETGALPLGSVERIVLTGPQIVTQDTAGDVIQYTDEGVR